MPTYTTDSACMLLTESNPLGTVHITSSAELQAIVEAIKPKRFRHLFTHHLLLDLRRDRLIESIYAVRPTVLHFAGHGDNAGITVSDGKGGTEVLDQDELVQILEGRSLHVLFLNACYSTTDHERLVKVAKVFVGSSNTVKNSVAVNFARGFYQALADGLKVGDAHRAAAMLAVPSGKADVYHVFGDLDFSIGEEIHSSRPPGLSDTVVDYFKTQSAVQRRSAWIQLAGSCASGALAVALLYVGWPRTALGIGIESLLGLPVAMISLLLATYFAIFSALARARANRLTEVAALAEALVGDDHPPPDLFEAFKAWVKRALGE